MALPDRAGTYRATPKEWGLVASKGSQSQAVAIRWQITYCQGPADWFPVAFEITSYSYVIGKNGDPNEKAIQNLVQVLGWDGNFTSLAGPPPAERDADLVIEEETFDGKKRMKVKWINLPGESGGGGLGERVDDSGLRALQNRLGSRMRAMVSATPKPPPAAPAAPAAPVAAPVAAAASRDTLAGDARSADELGRPSSDDTPF